MNNCIVIVLDGIGIGELPDAHKYGDEGSNTIVNIAEKVNGLNLPNLQNFGIGNIENIKGVEPVNSPQASYGKMSEASVGKDSTTGHWEIGGIKTVKEFPLYPKGFPKEIIDEFCKLNNLTGILGNKAASGTEIIKELGEEHVQTGKPIVYTSGDSVFQIAAHEEIIPLEQLYKICKVTREEILVGKHRLGRVIARPFIGEPGSFTRTTNRKDFSVNPPADTILDLLKSNNITTVGIGKVNDLFNYQGVTNTIITKSNDEGVNKIIDSIKKFDNSFIFANLVDFDVYYGHRLDTEGFAQAIEDFDKRFPEILNLLSESDLLIITADHGNDPTLNITDHTREYVPLLMYQKGEVGKNLGIRDSFSDIAQTAAHFFKVNNTLQGNSLLKD